MTLGLYLYTKRKKLGREAPDLITKHLPDDLIMTPAWVDCLRWSIGEPEILAEFRAYTGCDFTPRLTSIDRMIDEATGREQAFVEQYVAWFNENVWGRRITICIKEGYGHPTGFVHRRCDQRP